MKLVNFESCDIMISISILGRVNFLIYSESQIILSSKYRYGITDIGVDNIFKEVFARFGGLDPKFRPF